MCRVSPSAVWYIDQYGGFDEYMMYAPQALFKDSVALMYRKRIYQIYEQKKDQLRFPILDAAETGYGPEYVQKLQEHYQNVDQVLLDDVKMFVDKQRAKRMSTYSSLVVENGKIHYKELLKGGYKKESL